MLPVEVDPMPSTMEMLWTCDVIGGVALAGSNCKCVQPSGAGEGGVEVVLVQPPTVCVTLSVVTTRNWIVLVLHVMAARK